MIAPAGLAAMGADVAAFMRETWRSDQTRALQALRDRGWSSLSYVLLPVSAVPFDVTALHVVTCHPRLVMQLAQRASYANGPDGLEQATVILLAEAIALSDYLATPGNVITREAIGAMFLAICRVIGAEPTSLPVVQMKPPPPPAPTEARAL